MLTVSQKAQGKLEELIRNRASEPDTAIRIASSPENADQFQMLIDKEKSGDQVVTSQSGTKVLLLDSGLSNSLDGQVLDYIDTAEKQGFSIGPAAPSAQ